MKAKKSAASLLHAKRGEDQFHDWFAEFTKECHAATRRKSRSRNSFDFAVMVTETAPGDDGPGGSSLNRLPSPMLPNLSEAQLPQSGLTMPPMHIAPPTPVGQSMTSLDMEHGAGEAVPDVKELADTMSPARVPAASSGESSNPPAKPQGGLLSEDTFRITKIHSGLSQLSPFGSGRSNIGRSNRTSFTQSPMSPHSRVDRFINGMSREELQRQLSKVARIAFEMFIGQDVQEVPKEAAAPHDGLGLTVGSVNEASFESPEEDEEKMGPSFKVGTVFTVCGDHLEQTNVSIDADELGLHFAQPGAIASDEMTPTLANAAVSQFVVDVERASNAEQDPAERSISDTSPNSEVLSLTTTRTTFSIDVDDEEHYHRPFKKFSRLVKEKDFEGNKVINEYVIVADIGKGSYGKVKLAAHRDDPKDVVAIKIINRSLTKKSRRASCASPDFEAQIRREIAIMKKLRHRNIVPLHAVIDDTSVDKLYLIMEYVPGGELLKLETDPAKLAEGFIYQPLPEAMSANVLQQLTDGLRCLHKHHICHRDIKPANILKDMDSQVYLADFGVSELMDVAASTEMASSTNSNSVKGSKGTPLFWPPEMFSFNVWDMDVDGEMLDLWALGVTAFMMLTGKSPFRGTSFIDIAASVCTDDLQIPGSLSADAASLLEAMLSKNVDRRLRLTDIRNHAFLGGPDTRSAAARGSLFAEIPTAEDVQTAIVPGTIRSVEGTPVPMDATVSQVAIVLTDATRTSEASDAQTTQFCDLESLIAAQASLATHSPAPQVLYRTHFCWRTSLVKPLASPPGSPNPNGRSSPRVREPTAVSLPPILSGMAPSPPKGYQMPFKRSGSML